MQTTNGDTLPPLPGYPFPSDATAARAFAEWRIRTMPADWRRTLERIQTVFPEVVLAGGALRDHVLGRPVNDLDFFICTGKPAFPDMALALEAAVQAGAMQAGGIIAAVPRPVEGGHDAVSFIFQTTSEAGWPVQIVDRVPDGDGSAMMHRMVNFSDFGICRLATDGEEVLVHPHFIHDAQQQVFTLRRMNETMEAEVARWQKLCLKYQGWTFVDAVSDGAVGDL